MNPTPTENLFLRGLSGILLYLAALLATSPLTNAAQQTQTLQLAAGWNAIWLETSPTDAEGNAASVEDIFTDANITFIARPVTPVGTAEFISDPTITYNQDGWVIWNRDSVSGNTLTTIRGNQAYIVFNNGASAISQTVTGDVDFFEPTWLAGSYNLVGFNLSGSPTFSEFFGSAGLSTGVHPISKLFSLDPITGHWQSVTSSSSMQPGAAYWVFSTRNSTFAGPISIEFDGISDLSFGTGPGDLELQAASGAVFLTKRELTFTNVDTSDHAVSFTKVSPTSDELALYHVVPVPDTLSYSLSPDTPLSTWAIGTIASTSSQTVTVGANRNWSGGGNLRENLYRFEVAIGSSGAYQYFWLPVEASRTDSGNAANGTPDPAYAGLWVGQVNLDTVTSIAEAGSPAVATTATLPMEVILHVDASGNPSLLSHVIFMQTKTADENIPSEPVLVVDENKIPYFEGILEKEGKLVGRRIETAAYDMPLVYDTSAQPTSLLTIIAEVKGYVDASGNTDPSQVTADNLETYTLEAASRPPGFVGEYALSWPLTGGFGPNAIVTTGSSPLRLDPYHRSNPFRHAYHPQHGTGYAISRTMTFTFDTTTEDGLLQGTYSEAIDGLNSMFSPLVTPTATPLVASGSFTLQRVSTVSDIQ